jgi:hypothetical protein
LDVACFAEILKVKCVGGFNGFDPGLWVRRSSPWGQAGIADFGFSLLDFRGKMDLEIAVAVLDRIG